MLSRSKALELRYELIDMGFVPLSVARLNSRRATGVERRSGWLGGKSSEGPKPMDGSGVKQSHEVSEGLNR
jgi:hypothetical protein